jgi:flagellar protein FliL
MADKDKKAAKDDAKDDKAEDAAEKKEGEEGAAEGEEADGGKKGLKGLLANKKIVIIIAGALVVLLGGGAGLYFSGILGAKKEMTEEEKAVAEEHAKAEADKAAVFYELGDILVNLSGEGKRPNYLKIKVALELASEKDKPLMDQLKPRILDNFQVYLRELRIDDLKGSAGIYRLREELLMRVTEAAHPARVRDVLFQEMLVQ